MTHRTHTTSNTTSRKGGVPHHLHEWYSLPSTSTTTTTSTTSPAADPSQPSPDRVTHRRISISTWTITTSRGAIGNSSYMDTLSDHLSIPPPEMVFPSNTLTVKHEPTGWTYTFSAEEALRCVEGVKEGSRMQGLDLSADWRGGGAGVGTAAQRRHHLGEKPQKKKGKGIKVAYAEEWGKSRNDPAGVGVGTSGNGNDDKTSSSTATTLQQPTPPTPTEPPTTAFGAAAATQIADAREYDWTYSTTWTGGVDEAATATTSSSSSLPRFEPGTNPAEDRIPVERLGPSSGEPILFYDDLVLFEDELGDNGSSMLGVKIRVMPSGFLILQRFFLRVDDVVFRLFDVRVYCAFNERADDANGAAKPATTTAATATAMPGVGSLSLGPTRREMASTSGSSGSGSEDTGADATSTSRRPPQKLIRECSGCEAPYKEVRAKLPPYRPNDLSLLTDPGWVSQTLQSIVAKKQFASSTQAPMTTQHPAYAGVGPTIAPARFPQGGATPGQQLPTPVDQGAAVLGQLDEDVWEGVGSRVDVVSF